MKLNIYWLIINLSPLKPLDGGQIAEYLLIKWFGSEKGSWITLMLGNCVALTGLLYFLIQQSYIFAGLFFFYGLKNFQAFRSNLKQKPSPFSRCNEAIQALEKGELEKARKIFTKLVKSKDEYIRLHSLEGLARILDREGKQQEACQLLSKIDPNKLSTGKWLLCQLAYTQGNFALIAKHANDIYDIRPTFETALLNAKTFARLNDSVLSAGWLNTALQFDEAKDKSIQEILADNAFDLVRQHESFQRQLKNSLRHTL